MRLGALCAWGNAQPDSSLSMRDCYGSQTQLWCTPRRPGHLVQEGNSFDALYASVNDLRASRAWWMQTALYLRGLHHERSYTEKQASAKELGLGAQVRKENRRLLSENLNRHHSWLFRRRYARCARLCVRGLLSGHALFPLCLLCMCVLLLSDAHDVARCARRYLVFLGMEAEHGGQGEHEEPFSAHMLATLRAVAKGNLSAYPDVRVKEIDSEVGGMCFFFWTGLAPRPASVSTPYACKQLFVDRVGSRRLAARKR